MRASNQQLTLLTKAEQSALYDIPEFDNDQRLEFLTFSENEQALICSRSSLAAKIYCALQLGYFKAVKTFFNFSLDEANLADIEFIQQQYFQNEPFELTTITSYEHYSQSKAIATLMGYKLWSSNYKLLLSEQVERLIQRDMSPQFIVMEILNFLEQQKIVRPKYTTLQMIISDALVFERNRLKLILEEGLSSADIATFLSLISENNTLEGLAVIKHDAKDFRVKSMSLERNKFQNLQEPYQIAKRLLPTLKLSQQNIHYYASLANYYTIYELRKKLKPEYTYLYLLCYIWKRYQQLNDNLINSFSFHLKHFTQEIKLKAHEAFSQYAIDQHKELLAIKQVAKFYVDELIPDNESFGDIRKKVFQIISKEQLTKTVGKSVKAPQKEIDFRWQIVDSMTQRLRIHLRPVILLVAFSSDNTNNPWIKALNWLKNIFLANRRLDQYELDDCPESTIPKRIIPVFTKNTPSGKKLNIARYEYWVYRHLLKRIESGEIYIEDSVNYRSLLKELVSIEEKANILEELNLPALTKSISLQLDEKFTELHNLWIDFNRDLKKGKLKHLNYDAKTDTLHLQKIKEDLVEEIQHEFYQQLPLTDITDVLRFVHEGCGFLSALTHIQPRYAKQAANLDSLIATILAQGMNNGNLNMAEVSDIPYDLLQDILQSRLRLATLKTANDIISNAIAKMSIFPFYSFDLDILYGGVDGQKFEVANPTIKARHGKKYFGKGKGVVAYTMLANHIPLQVELIGANEHESYFAFDIWYNNTSNIVPDVITGDMHCINKANFAIMDFFNGKLYPRFTNLDAQRKHLYTGNDLSEYDKCLIKPIGQLSRQLIESEWPNIQRIIATLGLKETTQSSIIKKLCTFAPGNRTLKALFEYDKLIRSIHTLKYFRDSKIQRDTHRSQNRIESYHQLRAAIAQAYGTKQLTGRTDLAIEISNQCGRLIANAIIYFNSAILSKLRDKYEAIKNLKALEILKKISPIAWRHIHFLGHFIFSNIKSIDLDSIIERIELQAAH